MNESRVEGGGRVEEKGVVLLFLTRRHRRRWRRWVGFKMKASNQPATPS